MGNSNITTRSSLVGLEMGAAWGHHAWVSDDPLPDNGKTHPFGIMPIDQMMYSEKFCNAEGGDYRGRISWTKTGSRCQKWNSNIPTPHIYQPSKFKSMRTVRPGQRPTNYPITSESELDTDYDHNYCRTISNVPTEVPSDGSGGEGRDGGVWNKVKPNDGIRGNSDKQTPWCIASVDRNNNSYDPGTETNVFGGGESNKHNDLEYYDHGAKNNAEHRYKKGHYKSINLFHRIDKNGNGARSRTQNFGAQRCWVAHDNYLAWDCIDAADNPLSDKKKQTHGIHNSNILIEGGSYEIISKLTTSGDDGKIIVDNTDRNGPKNMFKKNEQGWEAKEKGVSQNNQEHWIRIELKDAIRINEIHILNKNKIPAAPIELHTYESMNPLNTYGTLGYNKIEYINSTSQKKIQNTFPTNKPMTFKKGFNDPNYANKETKIILITFPRTVKFNNGFGIKQISIVRKHNNYEVNYNRTSKKWELFDYSTIKNELIQDTAPKLLEFSSGYGLFFTGNQHLKCKYKLPIKLYHKLELDGTEPTMVKPIVMISCWFKVSASSETNSSRVLVSDEDGEFMPCVIDSDQNRLGCVIGNINDESNFHYSGISIGELKKGWHYLVLFYTGKNIYYYLNGKNPNNTKEGKKEGKNFQSYSGMCKITSGAMDNIYIIGNSRNKSNPWGYMSNLNLYCYWNKRYKDDDTMKNPVEINEDLFEKMETYVLRNWDHGQNKWNDYTCPDHSKTIQTAVNTAKARAVSANKHHLKQIKNKFQKDIKYQVQNAEDDAYKNILEYVSQNDNVIMWNSINVKGKKVQLTVQKEQSTDLEITNIQIYGNYNNQPSKNWVVDLNTTVDLSSQPNTEFTIDIDKIRSDKGQKSESTNYAKSTIGCNTNEHLISCKCFSTDQSCKGSKIIPDTLTKKYTGNEQIKYLCEATNKTGGGGVHAQVQCAKLTNTTLPKDSFILMPEKPITETSKHSEVSCPSGASGEKSSPYYMINCSGSAADTNNAVCANSEILQVEADDNENADKKIVCRAYPAVAGNPVSAQALCMKIPGESTLPNVSQIIKKSHPSNERSAPKDGSTANISCPESYNLIDGDCNSAIGNNACDSSQIDPTKNEITAYNASHGEGVSATANCMKFNIINDNCRDNNLTTRCTTGKTNKNPTITFTFDKLINIEKIVIYNREYDKNSNLPLHINIIDDHDHIIMTGVKDDYNTQIKIINTPPNPPEGCKGFDYLNITDKGYALINNKPAFRQWADVRGIGKKCDYCRITGSKDTKMVSCALGNNTFNQYAYNSNAGIKDDVINPPTQYMYPESNDKKDDFCYLKESPDDKRSTIECLKNTSSGFGEVFKPSDQDVNYAGLTGDQILANRKPLDTSGCIMNTFEDNYTNNSVDAGFYWPHMKKYFLFKNSILDATTMVIFKEFDAVDDTTNMAPLIMNVNNWPGIHFDKIDATLFLDVDPFRPDNKDQQLVFFFSNKLCIAYDLVEDKVVKLSGSVSRSSTINDYFPYLEKCGFDTIDSACYIGDGICYFFKNNQFIIYDLNNMMAPCNMSSSKNYISQTPTFSKLPFTSGIDSAICFYNPSIEIKQNNPTETTVLFFKDEQYIEWNINTNVVHNDTGVHYHIQPSININENENYVNLWKIELDESFSRVRTIYNDAESTQLISIPLIRSNNISDQFKRPTRLSNKEYNKCVNKQTPSTF